MAINQHNLEIKLLNQSMLNLVSDFKNITIKDTKTVKISDLYFNNSCKIILIPNTISIKLTTDILSILITLGFTVIIEAFDIETKLSLYQILKYIDNVIIDQDIVTDLKSFQNINYYVVQNNGETTTNINLFEKLNYSDLFISDIQSTIKLFQLVDFDLIAKDFDIIVSGYIVLLQNFVSSLKTTTINNLKTKTLYDTYYTET